MIKKWGIIACMLLGVGCKQIVELPKGEDMKEEDSVVKIQFTGDPEPVKIPARPATKWTPGTHNNITAVCAWQWGLHINRINVMQLASELPDEYQSGISNLYNQQWSHAWLIDMFGNWCWGDADDDLHDNIDQYSGEIESPEGYCGRSAKYYYELGDQYMGDWYLGYALHYIEDVGLVLHTTGEQPLDMLQHHFDFEAWVHNNLTSGHNFLDSIANDWYYYPVTDLKQAVYDAAYGCCYWTSTLGKEVWDAYKASGYPTATGAGSPELVKWTARMLKRTARYAKGVIKYALDKYNQWQYNGYMLSSNFYFRIKAKHSGKVIDVEDANTSDGANIIQWTYHGGDNQQWLFVEVEPGYYKIVAKHSGKVMDVAGGSTSDGANILQWTYHGGDNQKWQLVPAGGGYYYIICKLSGKAVDVAESSTSDGANIIQWTLHGGDNQKFRLDPVVPVD